MASFEEREQHVDAFVENLLQQLTREEKVSLCHSATKFGNAGVERLGIPVMEMSDGPHGVRQEISKDSWEPAGWKDDHSTYLPTGTAQAATWNVEQVKRCGHALGAEARERGKDVILGPGFNIIRTPLCGRNFEYYSEDPFLNARLAVAAVKGIQAEDTAACVKHYAVNNQELNRSATDVEMDERTLREIYLPAFEAAVKEGKVLTAMGAYNKFRGQHCCHHKYLVNDILKGEWEFLGSYISDWSGVRDTREAVEDGMDIEMGTRKPYNEYYLADPYMAGLESGEFSEETLDDKARRNLRVLYMAGAFDPERKPGARNTPEHQAIAQQTAEEAMVLLKNDDDVLPLRKEQIKTLAVIGKNAVTKHAPGGDSSAVKCLYEVTPLDGIRALLGDEVEVIYAEGYCGGNAGFIPINPEYLSTVDQGSGVKGWRLEYYANSNFEGSPLASENIKTPVYERETFTSIPGLERDAHSAIYFGELTAPDSGEYQFSFVSDGDVTLFIDGSEVASTNGSAYKQKESAKLCLKAGQTYAIQLRYASRSTMSSLQFGWVPHGGTETAQKTLLEEALSIAAKADAVIFCGGLTHHDDTEGKDRTHITLPDGQDALIEALLEVNANTVISLVGGSPVTMPWAERAKAILWLWYAGMEGGHAAARILFGEVSPSGKLPFTFPISLEESPAHKLGTYEAEKSVYGEGLFVGYRHHVSKDEAPLFAFGHGLSYAKFEYQNLRIQEGENDLLCIAKLDIINTGDATAKEIVQLYIEDVECSVERPKFELKAFKKVQLKAGERVCVSFEIKLPDLCFFDDESMEWTAEPGTFIFHVGSASDDIRLVGRYEHCGQRATCSV